MIMSDLLNSMMKTGTSPFARSLNNSFIQENSSATWDLEIPMLNIAMSGKMDVGYQSGVTVFAGPSKHFKTMYGLKMLDSFFNDINQHENIHDNPPVGIVIDTEYGITEDYLRQFPHIMNNLDRIIHLPVTTLEELRHEITSRIEVLYEDYKAAYKKSKNTPKPNIFILIDSIGQVASSKETVDAVDNKSKADLTRAKITKSIFRLITSKSKMLSIPICVIAHTYSDMGMFPKEIVSGGCLTEESKIWVESK
jgi:hypothetical protein